MPTRLPGTPGRIIRRRVQPAGPPTSSHEDEQDSRRTRGQVPSGLSPRRPHSPTERLARCSVAGDWHAVPTLRHLSVADGNQAAPPAFRRPHNSARLVPGGEGLSDNTAAHHGVPRRRWVLWLTRRQPDLAEQRRTRGRSARSAAWWDQGPRRSAWHAVSSPVATVTAVPGVLQRCPRRPPPRRHPSR